jgi:hypothetical protein
MMCAVPATCGVTVTRAVDRNAGTGPPDRKPPINQRIAIGIARAGGVEAQRLTERGLDGEWRLARDAGHTAMP